MEKIDDLTTCSPEETERFAEKLAQIWPRGVPIAMFGDLGAGKTAFARGFARGLGIDEVLSSPTYTIIQEYACPGGGKLYHMDLYRIGDARSALAFGVDEYLNDPRSWILIEWPERIESLLPLNTAKLFIRHGEGDTRHLHFVLAADTVI